MNTVSVASSTKVSSIGTLLSLRPIHWFQFADDAAVVSGQENENQLLLNRFTLWCQWADMIIRVDKCVTFGMKKSTNEISSVSTKALYQQSASTLC